MPEGFETTITVGENSYIGIGGADEYFAGRLHTGSWGETDNSTKEAALKQATKEIDRQPLGGCKEAAKEAGIKGYGKMSKAELIEALKAGE